MRYVDISHKLWAFNRANTAFRNIRTVDDSDGIIEAPWLKTWQAHWSIDWVCSTGCCGTLIGFCDNMSSWSTYVTILSLWMGEASQSNSICFSGFATAINQIKFGEKNSGFQNFPSKDSWFHDVPRFHANFVSRLSHLAGCAAADNFAGGRFLIESAEQTSHDGCEILHQLVDGLSHYDPMM